MRHDLTRVKNKKKDIENETGFQHDTNCAIQLDSGHPDNEKLNGCQQCTQKDKQIELLTKEVEELTLNKHPLSKKLRNQ